MKAFGETINNTFTVIGENFKQYSYIFLIYIGLSAANVVICSYLEIPVLVTILMILICILLAILNIYIIVRSGTAYNRRWVSARALSNLSLRRFFPWLWTTILCLLLVSLLSLIIVGVYFSGLFVLPVIVDYLLMLIQVAAAIALIMFSPIFYLAVMSSIFHKTNGTLAIKRALRIMKMRYWPVFFTLLITVIVIYLLILLMTYLTSLLGVVAISSVAILLIAFFSIFVHTLFSIIYVDLDKSIVYKLK